MLHTLCTDIHLHIYAIIQKLPEPSMEENVTYVFFIYVFFSFILNTHLPKKISFLRVLALRRFLPNKLKQHTN